MRKLFLLFLITVLIVGCSKPPEAEFSSADTAMKSAQEAQADIYAPDAYKAAQSAFDEANNLKQQEDGKFAMIRNYSAVKEMLVKVTSLASKAAAEARNEKVRVKKETSDMFVSVSEEINKVAESLSSVKITKANKEAVENCKNNLNGIRAIYDEAQTQS